MNELVFEVIQEADGGYCAECLTESIVTEGSSWDELRNNVREAVRGYYFDYRDLIVVNEQERFTPDRVPLSDGARILSFGAMMRPSSMDWAPSAFRTRPPVETSLAALSRLISLI